MGRRGGGRSRWGGGRGRWGDSDRFLERSFASWVRLKEELIFKAKIEQPHEACSWKCLYIIYVNGTAHVVSCPGIYRESLVGALSIQYVGEWGGE